MEKSDLRKAIRFIFVPALLLSIFLSGSATLLSHTKMAMLGKQIIFHEIPALKIATFYSQAILVILLLLFSLYKPFEKVFKATLVTLVAIISLLTGFVLFQDHFLVTNISEKLGLYQKLVIHWPSSLFYIVLDTVNFTLFSILIWGFVNRLMTTVSGVKYYIPLAFILGLAAAAITNFGLVSMSPLNWSLLTKVIPAIALMICALLIFCWSWKRLPKDYTNPEKEPTTPQRSFPYLSCAYLLAGSAIVKNLLDLLFKSQMKTQLPDPSSYTKFMADYAISIGYSLVAFSILWVVLGTWLVIRKGWKTAALCASLSLILGGIIYLSLSSGSINWLNQGIFIGLLTGTTSTALFPLVQIVYLYMPTQNRFKTKIITEMIALPVMKIIPTIAIQTTLVAYGSIAAFTPYLKIAAPILLLLLLISIKNASSKAPNIIR